MDAYETICTRRSVRKYNDTKISKEILEKIVYAGQCAPTAMNRQPVGFIVIQDDALIQKISKMNAAVMNMDVDPFYGANTVIVVVVDSSSPTTFECDGALAMGNLMNAAHALGVSSCWIHRARQVFDSDEGRALLTEWGFDEKYVGIGNCILGYSDEQPTMSPRISKVVWK